MQDFAYVIGTMPFTVVVSSKDGKTRLGISVETAESKWSEVFATKSIEVDPGVVLSNLVSYWNKIAGPYAGQPGERFAMDLSLLASSFPEGKVTYIREGVNVSFASSHGSMEPGSESVIPVEVLLATGNLLAAHAPPHLAEMWRRVSAPTDLPAFPILDMEMNQSDEDAARETEWYANSLGQSVAYYERLANWLHARHLAFAVGAPGYSEPTREEYDLSFAPAEVPSMSDIDRIYDLSKDLLKSSVEDLREQAVAGRNVVVRAENVFGRYFRKD